MHIPLLRHLFRVLISVHTIFAMADLCDGGPIPVKNLALKTTTRNPNLAVIPYFLGGRRVTEGREKRKKGEKKKGKVEKRRQ